MGQNDSRYEELNRLKKEKHDDLKLLIKQSVPIYDLADNFGLLTGKKSGINIDIVCPFCGAGQETKRRKSNASIREGDERFCCFSCGKRGDQIDLYTQCTGFTYWNAVIELAMEFGLITMDEYEWFTNSKKPMRKPVKKVELKKDVQENVKAAPLIIRDRVYREMVRYFGLSKRHENALVEKRELSKKEIKENMFFTLNNRPGFIEHCLKKFGPYSLLYVPGFYYNRQQKKWNIANNNYYLGIPIRNAFGLIQAIQIRSDHPDADPKYIYLSSSKYAHTEKFVYEPEKEPVDGIYGATAGSPVDIVIPDEVKTTAICVTEGKFKEVVVAKETGMVSYSVQGVGNWSGLEESIALTLRSAEVYDRYNDYRIGRNLEVKDWNPEILYLAFDADAFSKYQVYIQAKKLTDWAKEKGYEVKILVWDESLGKGIDDLYHNRKDANIILKRGCQNKTDFDARYKMIHQLMDMEAYKRKIPEGEMFMFYRTAYPEFSKLDIDEMVNLLKGNERAA